jgi:hypothetical protein
MVVAMSFADRLGDFNFTPTGYHSFCPNSTDEIEVARAENSGRDFPRPEGPKSTVISLRFLDGRPP